MPKARRSKLVHLTQVKKKPSQDKKQELISSIQGYLNNFTHIYVVKADNLRTHLLQAVREAMKPDTKFIFGKISIMTRGLQAATSTKDRLAPLVEALQMGGSSLGLAFSQLSPTDFQKALSNSTSTHDYARKGTMAPETVTLPDGPLMRNEELLPHTMERELRQLGLSVVMKKGQVSLEEPFTICEKDQPLTMQQADALRAFFIQFPLFSISLVAQTKL